MIGAVGSSTSAPLDNDEDVVRVRKLVRDRLVAAGFSLIDQTKMVTATSELARNNVRAPLRLGEVERKLRDVDRRKDEFLATLGHELRKPLGPIRNAVELLCRLDPEVPARQDNARRTIMRHTEHLVRLVDDLLGVARISQGKITLHDELVEVKECIAAALESVAHSIDSRRQRLSVTMAGQDAWIRGDHVRLTQIVGNLLHNASKFTPLDGAVTLSVTATDSQVVIDVADTGIGLDADSMDFIFGLFAQDGYSTDRVQDGLGIGLSLVRTMVGLHGGSVSAASPGRDQGSTFTVKLPRAEAEQPNGATSAASADNGAITAATRVLVVDDNMDSTDMLAELLRIDGHDVATAYSGAGALAQADTFAPQFVFLDIGLPDMSGYQVAASLREIAHMRDAILIALTGYGQESDRERAMQAGFNEHVVKPIDFATVKSLNLRPR